MSENVKSSWESEFPLDLQKIAELQQLALSIYARQATCALYSLKQFPMVPLAFLNLGAGNQTGLGLAALSSGHGAGTGAPGAAEAAQTGYACL